MAAAPECRDPQVITTRRALRAVVEEARRSGRRVGVVPTMGALHAGHLSLVAEARRHTDFVIVTIFVNPTQFGPQEDFQAYPRTLAADLAALAPLDVDVVFAPPPEEVYPAGHCTSVEVGGVAAPWEGARRPGHFRGVATVVLKLFQMCQADAAFFGRKDLQQSLVVRRMIDDLDLNVELHVCPIVRESDGLALSSRNAYLSAQGRRRATVLSRALRRGVERAQAGERSAEALLTAMREVLASEPEVTLDYLAIVDPRTLAELERIETTAYVIIAARVEQTRLIDNELLVVPSATTERS